MTKYADGCHDKGNIFFIMKNRLLKTGLALIVATGLLTALDICARPAIHGDFTVYQPDGTCFTARLAGDEFMKIFTTADGCAIGQTADGWYHYAVYDSDGMKALTDYRIGGSVPAGIMAASRIIPYDRLRTAASAARRTADVRSGDNILVRTKAACGPVTKNENAATGKHGIVILAQFADLKFDASNTRESFVKMLTEPGYSQNGATGSAMDYFNDQFKGLFSFSFDVSEIVTLSQGYAYYGANDGNGSDMHAADMVAEACKLADTRIDFSKYDDDGDGEVDNVFVFFAGGDEAEGAGENHIWSHAWYIKDGAGINLTLDGKTINRYACTAELSRVSGASNQYRIAGIGTFCHEFSHTLGLSDYYDTDYEQSGGQADALWGSTALMDGGNLNNGGNTPPNFNAPERDELGIFEAIPLTAGTHVLEPIDRNGQYYKMETDTDGEYFLFECRAAEGWDEYIGGSGLLIYHMDRSVNNADFSSTYGSLTAEDRWKYNEVNCNPQHQCADLIEADPSVRNTAYRLPQNVSKVFYPYITASSEYTSFSALTDPAFVFWSGTASPLAISGIERDGDSIRLTVSEFTGELPSPAEVSSEIYQDAAIISWTSDAGYTGEATVRWKKSSGNDEYRTVKVSPYQGNRYAVVIEGLTPLTPYRCDIMFEGNGSQSKETACNFTTRRSRDQNCPFIYLGYVEKNSDGTYPAGTGFPLRLYNAYDAEEIVWYMDGQEISVDGSCYYTPAASGEMKAEIFYDDGSKSIVTKTITIADGK